MKFQRRALDPRTSRSSSSSAACHHSDIHHGREHWRKETFLLITGHELAGVVRGGSSVNQFKVGSRVGVGCMVNSCRHRPCESRAVLENGTVLTRLERPRRVDDGEGYSTFNVVDEDFVIGSRTSSISRTRGR